MNAARECIEQIEACYPDEDITIIDIDHDAGDYKDDGSKITFKIDGKTVTFEKKGDMNVIAGDKSYKRPFIEIPMLTLGLRKAVKVPLAIVNHRDKKTTNLLLTRDILSKLGYVVHPNQSHILTREMEKVNII